MQCKTLTLEAPQPLKMVIPVPVPPCTKACTAPAKKMTPSPRKKQGGHKGEERHLLGIDDKQPDL
jgi:hypothetical protein